MNPLSSTSCSIGGEPAAASQAGRAERRPLASITRSAGSSSPASVRTPVTWMAPGAAAAPVSSPATATPRRTVTPGVSSAAAATDRSTMALRPVITSKRSSPSRQPPVMKSGTLRTMLS